MKISDPMPPVPRALIATSRSLDASIATVICVPCFRRPQHLRLTLESLVSEADMEAKRDEVLGRIRA